MSGFEGKLGKYKIISTEDNSRTVYSEYFDEACHNLSGAYEETLHNYILGCSIPDLLARENDFAILDVGFGVGVGLKAVIDQLNSSNFSHTIHYYSIELDEDLFLWSIKETLPELQFIKKEFYYECVNDHLNAKIFIGDGRVTLPIAYDQGLILPINSIFQDPFSPKKNPVLWSVEWFLFLRKISKADVILSTYSSSISIRKSLVNAGWTVINTKGFAMKRSMTKAVLTGETAPELLEQLARSPSLEIRDK